MENQTKTNLLVIALSVGIVSAIYIILGLNRDVENLQARVDTLENSRWELKGNIEQNITDFQMKVISDLNKVLEANKTKQE